MDNTQQTIFELIQKKRDELDKKDNTVSWKKFIGDYFVRVIIEFLSKEIPKSYQVTEPNAYITGFPVEYDLLIIMKGAKPEKYTRSFDPKDVHLGMELKMNGIYGSRKDLKKNIQKVKNNFDLVKDEHNHTDFVYLTFSEVTNPKRKGSIDYLEINRDVFEPDYGAFCLSDSRREAITPDLENQWVNFVQKVNRHLV
jgi:hypothetical protein|tara:strand:- start:203 stop:793 length:591 start_codon:yes stop_codon:yes gene_type:complete